MLIKCEKCGLDYNSALTCACEEIVPLLSSERRHWYAEGFEDGFEDGYDAGMRAELKRSIRELRESAAQHHSA